MIKTVIFDLGGVIVPLDFPAGYRAIAARCDVAAEDVPKRIGDTGLVPMLESGQVESEEFIRKVSEALGLAVSESEFRQLWSSIFPPHTLIPESLLAGLKRNYRLLLLSNTNSIHFEMICRNYALLGQFHDYVLSYKVGAMKPSPRIYEAALALAGCRPEECFFTDDIPAYVEGARQAGIDAVQFQGFERLSEELDRRGIAWSI
ncbi:MAG: HAD family phosphatase [Bryobacteraceae bacterium]|nr:HAD family phosphatase [Bryobacteraceae bacterium]